MQKKRKYARDFDLKKTNKKEYKPILDILYLYTELD